MRRSPGIFEFKFHHFRPKKFEFKRHRANFRWKEDLKQYKSYEAFPQKAKDYVERIEQLTGVPVSWIGTGPERESMVMKH